MGTGGVSSLNPQGDERAVSPVVGMIMVLAISIVGTVAVMTWGLPAIDEMKSSVEVQSVKGQMQEFLADIQELVAGTAGKTAKRWQPSLTRGELYLNENTQPWIIAVDKRATYDGVTRDAWNFEWGCTVDATLPSPNHGICVRNSGAWVVEVPSVKVYDLSGSTETEGHVSKTTTPGTDPDFRAGNMDGRWDPTEKYDFYFFEDSGGTELKLAGRALKVEILNGTDVIAAAWFFEAGDATFELNAGIQKKSLFVENGALFQGTEENFVLLNNPPVPPPKTSGGANRLFVRFVEMDGAGQFAGQHRNDVLLTLDSTSVREDLNCPTAVASDDAECVNNVKLYPLGDRASDWITFFTGSTYGMTSTQNGGWDPNGSTYAQHQPGTARATFTLVHSVIEVST